MSVDSMIDKCVSQFGLWWPDAEEGDCRLAAAHWSRLGEDILQAVTDGSAAATAIAAGNCGDTVDSFERFWGCYEHVNLPGVADSCQSMAQALVEFAGHVEDAKHQCHQLAKKMLAAAAVGIGLAIATGWLIAPAVSAGVGMLAAQSVVIAAHLSAVLGAVESIVTGLIMAEVN